MSLSAFRHALRQIRRSLAVLSLSSAAFYYLVLFSSASFAADRRGARFLARPPRAVEAFLGGSVDLFQPSGWLAAAMTHPVTLSLLVGAALAVAAGAVATEVERGTIDLVLTRPVGRIPFLLGKAAASLVAVTAVQVAGAVGVVVARLTVDQVAELALSQVARSFLVSWALFATLGMVGILVSARSSLRGRAIGISVGLIVAWFFMRFIALLIDEVEPMRFASPFNYFRPSDLVAGQPLLWDALVLLAVGAGALLGGLFWFARRDLSR